MPLSPHSPRRRTRTAGLAAASAVAVAALLGGAPAAFAGDRTVADPATSARPLELHASAAETADAVAFWTPARMAAATRSDDAATTVDALDAAAPAADDDASIAASDATAPAPISTAEQVPSVPHIGKLFGIFGSSIETCSANVVVSGNHSVVATAAHCVLRGGQYASRLIFAPAYANGQDPYGTWALSGAVAAAGYAQDESDQGDDTAFAVAAPNEDGADIASVVGASPVLFDQDPAELGTVYGYPGSGRFDARTLQRCRGVFETFDPERIDVACDMNEGVSGGPIFAGDGSDGAEFGNAAARFQDSSHVVGTLWKTTEHAAYDQAASAPAVPAQG
ncbi:trypsin-like peptidase domain-containing protein [Clavibacter sp. VKM Ac-2873]|uniref:trypsin-like serine peptidase n=1 Tax=Clavibacter sp. VKM Ac-2873 TaxID=2783813 RepID=UPI00188B7B4F|nr:trypsin-like peptidase domain-containing protein [Clavibacter sp. VKM Ac-2873]MBF4619350.1 trypsin-like peptidase domain-containing protein [Clavibacter sp. VKM Ac-2873]